MFLDRGTALLLLTVLLDWHDAIVCISSVSQFNILEANKVKGLVVLIKTHQPFSFMSPPISIALGLISFLGFFGSVSDPFPVFTQFRPSESET